MPVKHHYQKQVHKKIYLSPFLFLSWNRLLSSGSAGSEAEHGLLTGMNTHTEQGSSITFLAQRLNIDMSGGE